MITKVVHLKCGIQLIHRSLVASIVHHRRVLELADPLTYAAGTDRLLRAELLYLLERQQRHLLLHVERLARLRG